MTKEELLALGVDEETATKIIEEQNKSYIPKYRYNEVAQERDNLKETIADRDKQLKSLKENEGTIEELKEQIDSLTATNKEQAKKHKDELQKVVKENAITEYLRNNNVKNVEVVKKLLDYNLITNDDNGLKGIEEQVKTLKEDASLSSLFEVEKSLTGGKPIEPNGGTPTPKGIFDDVLNIAENDNTFNPWA